jgi:hypothetical protein
MTPTPRYCTAFEGGRRIAAGPLKAVAIQVKALTDRNHPEALFVFDDLTSELIELDLRGTSEDVLTRLERTEDAGAGEDPPHMPVAEKAPRGPGRPKLGVIAREVTLLPRHWEWLGSQPGGASVAMRKLVEEARRTHEGKDRVRRAQEVGYRFLSAIAGHQPGFEEASRALFAGQADRFDAVTAAWPRDVHDHACKLLAPAFAPESAEAA